MILLDAYALIALLANERGANEVEALINGEQAAVAAPNLAETADRLQRVHGIAIDRTRGLVDTLVESAGMRVLSLEPEHAWNGARIRAAYYHRTDSPLSLADCLLLAVAGESDRVASADRHLLAAAAVEGIPRVELP